MAETLEQVARSLVEELETRFPYAAALISGSSGVEISDNGNEQTASEVTPSRGIVFTIYDGASFVEYATSDLAPDTLTRNVRVWASSQRIRPGGAPVVNAGYSTIVGSQVRSFHTPMVSDPVAIPLRAKLAMLRDVQRRAKALDQRIVQAQAQYSDRTQETRYIGRGRKLHQRITRTLLALFVAVSDGANVRYHFIQKSGTGGYELAQLSDAELAATVETAVRLLSAERITPDAYDIVTDPSLSGVIAHECFGHGVELDLFPKGRARSARYLNQQVAAPAVQMFDDPARPGAIGSYYFDDEGELARPTQILKNGVFVRPISDFASATYTPGLHTANGRRQDFSRKTYARMSNTFFSSDPDGPSPAELIAGVEHGIYLRQAESGMEDPMGWGIQVTAHYGEEIANGRLTGRLFAPVGVTGYVPDLLQSINGIGSDFDLFAGFCGKGHKEFVVTSCGGPHLRMKARLG
ncbi:MAG TPA: TldD/PmbA family protein [Ktedonobacterales bacterium]|nr:TldD/PmbA family protein [Ktedonobacterales bacterium]